MLLSCTMMSVLSAPAISHQNISTLSLRTGHLYEQKHMACMHAFVGSDQQKALFEICVE